MIFHDFTVLATGDQRSHRQHDTDTLEPKAIEVFRELITHQGASFRRSIYPAPPHIQLQWTRECGAALATFWSETTPLTISALVTGRDPTSDKQALQHLQQLIVRVLRDTVVEPGFDLLSIAERPAIVSVPLPVQMALREDMEIVADMETCLAAAFFLEMSEPVLA